MAIALLAVLALVYASQLALAGTMSSFPAALGAEVVFWFSWALVALLIFRLCRWLHRGTQNWKRYVLVLSAGAAGAIVVFPTLFRSVLSALLWLGQALAFITTPVPPYWPSVRATFMNLIGPTAVLYAGTVFAWHAVTYYRDLQERKLKAVQLESLLHQAQLETLRSQLHPHFLFNTLHSIAELVHENPPLAEQVILRLADLLRQVLRAPVRQEIPLSEEIAFLQSYVGIEQIRLGDRLVVEWDLDPAALEACVPSLVLQPLVENAIQHGIAALARPGRLAIRTRREEAFLHLQVQDTGPGLPAETTAIGNGIGLANTAARLQRLYGSNHRFELVNQNGLAVHVWIPFRQIADATTPRSSDT
jgi:signal transduction histidine kinase